MAEVDVVGRDVGQIIGAELALSGHDVLADGPLEGEICIRLEVTARVVTRELHAVDLVLFRPCAGVSAARKSIRRWRCRVRLKLRPLGAGGPISAFWEGQLGADIVNNRVSVHAARRPGSI
jgi:hypothetical protein